MSNYTADSIQHLETREAMRSRIQMYLGSDDTDGIYQAFKEIINNSTDEALAGYGKEIHIQVSEEKNSVQIRDYGRGVPFSTVNGKNILVAIYTESHTGGKFDKGAYKNSSGLNGIGGTAVCMSSEYFFVKSIRDGKIAEAQFKKGELIDYSELTEEEFKKINRHDFEGKTGTIVGFIPDRQVFQNMSEGFTFERICSEIKNISYLNKGIRFIIEDDKGNKKEFYSENGIADFIKDHARTPLMKAPIVASASDGIDELEISFIWTGESSSSYVFVNGLYCPEGGSPITGAKTTITTSIKRLSGKDFDAELIRKGLIYAINCKVTNPSFANQTKSKINNPNLRTLASQAFKEGLEEFANTPDFAPIIEMMKKYQAAEKAADKARESILNHTKEMNLLHKSKLQFIEKLHDAEELGENSTLFISEGSSAAQALLSGRRTKTDGVMEIKGKMLNTFKAKEERILNNEEIKLFLYALGQTIYDYNAKKLRYGKIAIAADQDADGFSIALLIMVVVQTICPQILKENRLYRLYSPLYIEHDKKGYPINWWYSDDEYNEARSKIKGEIARIKGWGSLSDEDLKETIFSENGRMDRILFSEEGLETLQALMGIDVKPRKDFVFNNIDFSTFGEII